MAFPGVNTWLVVHEVPTCATTRVP